MCLVQNIDELKQKHLKILLDKYNIRSLQKQSWRIQAPIYYLGKGPFPEYRGWRYACRQENSNIIFYIILGNSAKYFVLTTDPDYAAPINIPLTQENLEQKITELLRGQL